MAKTNVLSFPKQRSDFEVLAKAAYALASGAATGGYLILFNEAGITERTPLGSAISPSVLDDPAEKE